MTSCLPIFLRGTGLGNRLFSWARAEVYARRHGLPMVSPVWASPRWRPFLLGGVSRANYLHQIALVNVFRRHPDEAGLVRMARLRAFGTRWPEPLDLSQPPPSGDGYIGFSTPGGEYYSFRPLAADREFLHDRLRRSGRRRWRRQLDQWVGPAVEAIGMNVRRGKDFKDFNDARSKAEWYSMGLFRTPLDWFLRTLDQVRQAAGRAVPVLLVSDGTEADLQPLLAAGGITLVRPGCAYSDLLTLARTRVLIGSGGSTFSAWAAFLGGMPTLSHPGGDFEWLGLPTDDRQAAGAFDPDAPDARLLAACGKAFANP